MAPELCYVVVGANVPNIDPLVTTAHDNIAVASLLGAGTRSAQVGHVLWVSVELKTKDFGSREKLLLFLLTVPTLCKLSVSPSLGYFTVVNDHFKLWIYSTR